MNLLEWLSQKFPTAKRTTLRRMLQSGRVTVNGKATLRAKEEVGAGDQVEVLEQPADGGKAVAAKKPPFEIVHEDEDVIVVLKPPGILTSTNQREKRATVKQMLHEYIAQHRPKAVVGAVHRLDRDASGLLVFSLNNNAYRHLKRQFFHHTVDRVYTAVVEGRVTPPEGKIETRLVERGDGRVVPAIKPGSGEEAITHYRTVATARVRVEGEAPQKKPRRRERPDRKDDKKRPGAQRQTITLLRITLHTGRKHQIRAHFAAREHPVVGDMLYGDETLSNRLLLAATQLAFDHPRTGERLSFSIRPPKEIVRLFPETSERP